MTYPKWLYHKSHPAMVVHNEQEEKDLGKGWEEKPFVTEEKAEKEEAEQEEPASKSKKTKG